MKAASELDRRQFKRHPVKGDFFITFRPEFRRMGRVKDISKGGVGLEYTIYDDQKALENVEVDIFSAEADLHISKIPCKVAYDVRVDNYPSFDNLQVRRCGLEFAELSYQQYAAINSLVSLHTASP
ncbi:PilZ domain-containing protein [Desulfoferrobacter suflitae]|uniref:PilZ domain-containing protein n=1 Tax=Desulfoferrobacter suflitae TaxID=2865782 RepID=UPI00216432BD|nr:PilZ domain-containing protein [Desulfoferrobacter suflitae]MCK8603895.1 PilZ domain-containing protein [Desulfoferrobacter suflitae]